MIFFAHRGAKGLEPENTLLAFRKAIDLKAQWVELDVYPIGSEIMVFHDLRLERVTNGKGFVWEQSPDYLRSLDAGKGEKIPFLGEVFDLVGPDIGVNIELKWPGSAGPVAKFIERRLANRTIRPEKCIVSSFNHPELQAFKTLLPQISTGALTGHLPLDLALFAEKMGAYSVHVALDVINPEFVHDAHNRGLKVFVFTVNHPEELAWMQDLGVDGVFTDFPDKIRETP